MIGVLLDTCAFLWLAADQEKLSPRARRLIQQSSGGLYLSAISAFEIGTKHEKRRIILPLAPKQWIREALTTHGVHDIPVNWQIAQRSTSLPPLHNDPCDRIIVATAQIMGLSVLTPDSLIRNYPDVEVQW